MALDYRITSLAAHCRRAPTTASGGGSPHPYDVIAKLRAFRDFGVGYVGGQFRLRCADAMVAEMRSLLREDFLGAIRRCKVENAVSA